MNLKLAALLVQVTLVTSCHVLWDVNWYDPEYQTPCVTQSTTQATTTTLSELCQNLIKAAEDKCGLQIEDKEHCQGVLEHLKEFCGYP